MASKLSSNYRLPWLCHALGWQGGTIHQVTEEINKRIGHIRGEYTVSDVLSMDSIDLDQVIYLLSKNQDEE